MAGIVLAALGVKTVVAGEESRLGAVGVFALCGGPAIYLVGHLLFRLRNVGTLNPRRLVAAVGLGALAPLATQLDPLLALGAVVAVLWALIAYEAIRYREARQRIRHHIESGEPQAAATAGTESPEAIRAISS